MNYRNNREGKKGTAIMNRSKKELKSFESATVNEIFLRSQWMDSVDVVKKKNA